MDLDCEIDVRLKDTEGGAEFHLRYTFSPTTKSYCYLWSDTGHYDVPEYIVSRLFKRLRILGFDLLKRPELEEDGEVQEHKGRGVDTLPTIKSPTDQITEAISRVPCNCAPSIECVRDTGILLDTHYCKRDRGII